MSLEIVEKGVVMIWNAFRYLVGVGTNLSATTLGSYLPAHVASFVSYFVGLVFGIVASLLIINFIFGALGQLVKVICYPIILLVVIGSSVIFYGRCRRDEFGDI